LAAVSTETQPRNVARKNRFDSAVRFGQTAGMAARESPPSRNIKRCFWCGDDPLMIAYHDTEWGVPVHDDRLLFEFLILEGAQAGLSWSTILRKRLAYRRAFADFDVARVARFTPQKLERLMLDAGIVRNRLKLESTVRNARAFLKVQQEFGSFAEYQWRFVGGVPIQGGVRTKADIVPRTTVSDAFSKDLKKRGFNFVGSTIIYAHMQAVGMVNDHVRDCFRHAPLSGAVKRRPKTSKT
jgi:DNA-3-methyladenine glycosylase I